MERQPAVAGRFYPDDEQELRDEVRRLLAPVPETETLPSDRPLVGFAPHAGYMYSGSVAAELYGRVEVPAVTIVLCPNHTGVGARAAIMSHGRWRLPGTSVGIASVAAEEFRSLAGLTEDAQAHAREHSLEVQLPFLAHRNPRGRIVPVCLGFMPYESCVRIGSALADIATRHDALVVASTDMSHYVPADVARRLDRLALDRIEAIDPKGLYETVRDHDISMCGVIPSAVALVAARSLGATTGTTLRYGNSGETSGDHDRVVGYAACLVQ